MPTNQIRRELLDRVKTSNFPGSIIDVFNAADQGIDLISQFEQEQQQEQAMQQQQQGMQVANTPEEQEIGLREQHAMGNTGASMAFPNVEPNQSFNTVGMKAPINIEKVNDQGHLVESYKNVPPGIQDLPTGPYKGTIIESPAGYQTGGVKKYHAGGLYHNINHKKKSGTSRSKSNSTISKKAYANMKSGFKKQKGGEYEYENLIPEIEVSGLTKKSYNKLSAAQKQVYDAYTNPYTGDFQQYSPFTLSDGSEGYIHWKDAMDMVKGSKVGNIYNNPGSTEFKVDEDGHFRAHAKVNPYRRITTSLANAQPWAGYLLSQMSDHNPYSSGDIYIPKIDASGKGGDHLGLYFRNSKNPEYDTSWKIEQAQYMNKLIAELGHLDPEEAPFWSYFSMPFSRMKRWVQEGSNPDASNYGTKYDIEYHTHYGPNSSERGLLKRYSKQPYTGIDTEGTYGHLKKKGGLRKKYQTAGLPVSKKFDYEEFMKESYHEQLNPGPRKNWTSGGNQKARNLWDEAMQFNINWLNSPMAEKMMKKEDPYNWKELKRTRINNIYDTPVFLHNRNEKGTLAQFGPNLGNLTKPNIDGFAKAFYRRSTAIHEGSHAADYNRNSQWSLKDLNPFLEKSSFDKAYPGRLIPKTSLNVIDTIVSNLNNTEYKRELKNMSGKEKEERLRKIKYYGKFTELRARLNAIRGLAKHRKIYDPFTQRVTDEIMDEIIDNLKTNEKTRYKGSNPVEQLLNLMTKKELKRLLNTVSDASDEIGDVQTGTSV